MGHCNMPLAEFHLTLRKYYSVGIYRVGQSIGHVFTSVRLLSVLKMANLLPMFFLFLMSSFAHADIDYNEVQIGVNDDVISEGIISVEPKEKRYIESEVEGEQTEIITCGTAAHMECIGLPTGTKIGLK